MISRLFARRAPRALFVGALVAMLFGANIAFAFDFDDVAALARRKARAAYQPPDRKQPAEAADMYRAALVETPDLPDAHYNLALLCEAAGLKQEAIRHLSAYRKLRRR